MTASAALAVFPIIGAFTLFMIVLGVVSVWSNQTKSE